MIQTQTVAEVSTQETQTAIDLIRFQTIEIDQTKLSIANSEIGSNFYFNLFLEANLQTKLSIANSEIGNNFFISTYFWKPTFRKVWGLPILKMVTIFNSTYL